MALKAICENTCQTPQDGVCDDGGFESLFSECLYGTDCGDCCPRDPFHGRDVRYTGAIDPAFTRAVCAQEIITLNLTSPCLNATDMSIEKALGSQQWRKAETTSLVVLILIGASLAVAVVVVPLLVYSQLVYSGLWPVLTCSQRLKCMLTGNYLAAGKAYTKKANEHKDRKRRRSRLAPYAAVASSTGHMQAPSYGDSSCGRVVACAGSKRMGRYSWCHFTQSWGWYVYGQRDGEAGGVEVCVFTLLFAPIIAFFNLLSWEILFDILPPALDTRCNRKIVKVIRLLSALYCLGFLVAYIPRYSLTNLESSQGSLMCVMESCKQAGWRKSAETLEDFECEAAQAAGVIQPSFWSDLVDIVSASLTLAVLTIVAEWRDSLQGKNEVGAALLAKFDKETDVKHDAQGLPGTPNLGKLGETQEDKFSRLRTLREDDDNDDIEAGSRKQQAKEAALKAAVNTSASGAKVTLAQLYTGVGSIAAVVFSAQAYDSQCLSTVLLWENSPNAAYTRVSEALVALVQGSVRPDTDSLELVLLKPSQRAIVTWASVFRATMSNLTLVTVGVAVKNVRCSQQRFELVPVETRVAHS